MQPRDRDYRTPAPQRGTRWSECPASQQALPVQHAPNRGGRCLARDRAPCRQITWHPRSSGVCHRPASHAVKPDAMHAVTTANRRTGTRSTVMRSPPIRTSIAGVAPLTGMGRPCVVIGISRSVCPGHGARAWVMGTPGIALGRTHIPKIDRQPAFSLFDLGYLDRDSGSLVPDVRRGTVPRRPRRPCTIPGCPELTPRGGRCPAHEREANRERASRGSTYDVRWQRIRRAYLYNHPWCVLCGTAATVADHFPLSRRELVARGEPNPDAWKHLRPLCTSCHNRETARNQPGGFAAERRSQRESGEVPPF